MSPQNILLALIAVAAGTFFPVQTSLNALLAKSVGGTIAATTFSIASSLFALLLINAFVFRQIPALSDLAATPPYLMITGGVLGATFLAIITLLAPKLGAAPTLCFVIAGQLMSALTIDRLGLFSFAVRELSFGRIAGVLLVFAGAVLVRLT